MIFLRSLFFNAALYGSTTVMCFLMMWALLLPRSAILKVVHLWLGQIAWIERNIGGLHYRVIGAENIPAGACIIAAKHQSAWETFKLHLLFGDPAIVLKKELLSIPVWGWYLKRSGMIPISRAARGQAIPGMMQAAHKAADMGRKIVIFPQGTRVAVGVDRPYKFGTALLYEELKLPVIPMALNSGVYWPKHKFAKIPGTITIEFLPAIPPGLPRDEMMAKLRDQLETASNRLAASR